MWERTGQESYFAWLVRTEESLSDRKTTDKLTSAWTQLSMAVYIEWTIDWNKLQRSVNDFWYCKYGNWPVIRSLVLITDVLAASIDIRASNMVTAPFWELASTERQQFWACILGNLWSDWLQISIDEILAASESKNHHGRLPDTSWICVSTERQQF